VPPCVHPREHVLDHVLGGGLVADQQRGQAHEFQLPVTEQVRDPGLLARHRRRLDSTPSIQGVVRQPRFSGYHAY